MEDELREFGGEWRHQGYAVIGGVVEGHEKHQPEQISISDNATRMNTLAQNSYDDE